MDEAIDKLNVFVNVIMLRWKCLETCSVYLMEVSWVGSKFDIGSCVKIVDALRVVYIISCQMVHASLGVNNENKALNVKKGFPLKL